MGKTGSETVSQGKQLRTCKYSLMQGDTIVLKLKECDHHGDNGTNRFHIELLQINISIYVNLTGKCPCKSKREMVG